MTLYKKLLNVDGEPWVWDPAEGGLLAEIAGGDEGDVIALRIYVECDQ